MEKLDQLNARWRAGKVTRLKVAKVETDVRLQVRVDKVIEVAKYRAQASRSDLQVTRMRTHLKSSKGAHLDAIIVAKIDNRYFIVDGHHRHRAYRLEKRSTIPARVHECAWEQAVLVSKCANNGHRSLEMTPEQYREALWQYLAIITGNGKRPIPRDNTTRILAARFNTSNGTVHNMRRGLPNVKVAEFAEVALDPHTGFPRWKYCKQQKWPIGLPELTPEDVEDRNNRKAAKAFGKTYDELGWGTFMNGLNIFRAERLTQHEEEAEVALEIGFEEGELDRF